MSANVSPVQTARVGRDQSSSDTMRGTTAAFAGRKNRLTVVTRNATA